MPATRSETPRERTSRWSAPVCVAALGMALILASSAAADVTVQSKSASLRVDGTDFFRLPGRQQSITAPDATNFGATAEVHVDGHGSVDMDVKTIQNTHAEISGDDLTLTSTQSFSILHQADDRDRENLVSHTNSFLTINFCTTKKSSFLFSASGQLAVPPDKCAAPSCKGFPFADAFVLATFTCDGFACPQTAFKQFVVGVNTDKVNGVAPQPSGGANGSGTIPPGCYELSTDMDAALTSPLLCKNKTGVCERFQIPPDINNSPPTANGSFTLTLSVTPTTSTNDDEITWVGPINGNFGDPANWDPQQVPTITPDESDTAIFAGGNTITVDVSAGGAANASLFAPRAGGSRAVGRLHVKGTKSLVVKNFQLLDLDDQSLDKASLRIGNGGTLQFSSGSLVVHNARIGLNGNGTLIVLDSNTLFTAGLLLVGEDGNGLLEVRDGAAADAGEARLGNGGGLGTAAIERLSKWTTGKLSVGHEGRALLSIQGSGDVTSTNAFVDESMPSAPVPADGPLLNRCGGRSGGANVEVTGHDPTPSTWHVNTLLIGGLGCVEAADGGKIIVGENAGGDVHIGISTGGEGVVFLDAGGGLVVGGNLTVGESGHGRLELDENHVSDPFLIVTGELRIGQGLAPAGTGIVTIRGDIQTNASSVTSDTARIPAGNDGHGVLDMKAGARITTTTSAEIGAQGTEQGPGSRRGDGFVHVDGRGAATFNDTRWSIGQSLTVGGTQVGSSTGNLLIENAVVAVGVGAEHGTVTINAGGHVFALDANASLLTNAGTIHNNGEIGGPLFVSATYAADSQGKLSVAFGGLPTISPAPPAPGAATNGAPPTADPSGRAAAQPPRPPEGPIVITGDADLTNTTLVLQFVNGFAPHQGDQFPVVDVQGQLTGDFAGVHVSGLAPGASFNVNPQTGVATSLTDAVALPVVTMKAPKTLKESAKKGGKIKLTRTGATTDPLTVSFSFGGSAEAGIDYGSARSITFPAKKKAATLVVVPFADGLRESTETIEVTLLPGDGYQTTSAPTVTIPLLSTEKKPKK